MSCQLYSTDASCPKDAADQEAEESAVSEKCAILRTRLGGLPEEDRQLPGINVMARSPLCLKIWLTGQSWHILEVHCSPQVCFGHIDLPNPRLGPFGVLWLLNVRMMEVMTAFL